MTDSPPDDASGSDDAPPDDTWDPGDEDAEPEPQADPDRPPEYAE
jgi:hypothetical protein